MSQAKNQAKSLFVNILNIKNRFFIATGLNYVLRWDGQKWHKETVEAEDGRMLSLAGEVVTLFDAGKVNRRWKERRWERPAAVFNQVRSVSLTAALKNCEKSGKWLETDLEEVLKSDVELFPSGEDFLFGIEADVAIEFSAAAIVKNLCRDFPDAVFLSRFGVSPDVNIPYPEFPLVARP